MFLSPVASPSARNTVPHSASPCPAKRIPTGKLAARFLTPDGAAKLVKKGFSLHDIAALERARGDPSVFAALKSGLSGGDDGGIDAAASSENHLQHMFLSPVAVGRKTNPPTGTETSFMPAAAKGSHSITAGGVASGDDGDGEASALLKTVERDESGRQQHQQELVSSSSSSSSAMVLFSSPFSSPTPYPLSHPDFQEEGEESEQLVPEDHAEGKSLLGVRLGEVVEGGSAADNGNATPEALQVAAVLRARQEEIEAIVAAVDHHHQGEVVQEEEEEEEEEESPGDACTDDTSSVDGSVRTDVVFFDHQAEATRLHQTQQSSEMGRALGGRGFQHNSKGTVGKVLSTPIPTAASSSASPATADRYGWALETPQNQQQKYRGDVFTSSSAFLPPHYAPAAERTEAERVYRKQQQASSAAAAPTSYAYRVSTVFGKSSIRRVVVAPPASLQKVNSTTNATALHPANVPFVSGSFHPDSDGAYDRNEAASPSFGVSPLPPHLRAMFTPSGSKFLEQQSSIERLSSVLGTSASAARFAQVSQHVATAALRYREWDDSAYGQEDEGGGDEDEAEEGREGGDKHPTIPMTTSFSSEVVPLNNKKAPRPFSPMVGGGASSASRSHSGIGHRGNPSTSDSASIAAVSSALVVRSLSFSPMPPQQKQKRSSLFDHQGNSGSVGDATPSSTSSSVDENEEEGVGESSSSSAAAAFLIQGLEHQSLPSSSSSVTSSSSEDAGAGAGDGDDVASGAYYDIEEKEGVWGGSEDSALFSCDDDEANDDDGASRSVSSRRRIVNASNQAMSPVLLKTRWGGWVKATPSTPLAAPSSSSSPSRAAPPPLRFGTSASFTSPSSSSTLYSSQKMMDAQSLALLLPPAVASSSSSSSSAVVAVAMPPGTSSASKLHIPSKERFHRLRPTGNADPVDRWHAVERQRASFAAKMARALRRSAVTPALETFSKLRKALPLQEEEEEEEEGASLISSPVINE